MLTKREARRLWRRIQLGELASVAVVGVTMLLIAAAMLYVAGVL